MNFRNVSLSGLTPALYEPGPIALFPLRLDWELIATLLAFLLVVHFFSCDGLLLNIKFSFTVPPRVLGPSLTTTHLSQLRLIALIA